MHCNLEIVIYINKLVLGDIFAESLYTIFMHEKDF